MEPTNPKPDSPRTLRTFETMRSDVLHKAHEVGGTATINASHIETHQMISIRAIVSDDMRGHYFSYRIDGKRASVWDILQLL